MTDTTNKPSLDMNVIRAQLQGKGRTRKTVTKKGLEVTGADEWLEEDEGELLEDGD